MNKIILLFLLMLPFAAALDVDLTLSKNQAQLGDTILANVVISSDTEISGTMIFDFNINTIVYESEPYEERFTLPAGGTKTWSHPLEIAQGTPSGNYNTNLRILDSAEQVIATHSVNFRITGTKTYFEKRILVCGHRSCSTIKRVFKAGEKVYLDFESELGEKSLKALLYLPTGTVNLVELPYEFIPESTGTYSIEPVESDNYVTLSRREQFAVMSEIPKITSRAICEVNNRCEGDENAANCPQDCVTGSEDRLCDNAADGKCDPDCPTKDIDCIKQAPAEAQGRNIPVLLFIALAAALISLFILFKKKR